MNKEFFLCLCFFLCKNLNSKIKVESNHLENLRWCISLDKMTKIIWNEPIWPHECCSLLANCRLKDVFLWHHLIFFFYRYPNTPVLAGGCKHKANGTASWTCTEVFHLYSPIIIQASSQKHYQTAVSFLPCFLPFSLTSNSLSSRLPLTNRNLPFWFPDSESVSRPRRQRHTSEGTPTATAAELLILR